MTDTFQLIGEAARRVVGRLAAAQRIAPGLYLDMHPSDYFADPCPSPSLTQSIAKTLLDHSPAHARLEHPRLNPDYQPSDPKKYDVGNIAHALLLGRGRDLVVIDGDDWVSDRKAKSEAREAALAEGKLAVLSRDYETGIRMVAAARRQIEAIGYSEPWADGAGDGEVVIAWREGPIWFRSMIDWLPANRRTVFDYKTTGTSAAPQAVGRRVPDGGWDVQAAMHERGLDAIFPHDAGRRHHVFLCQEDYPPYALTAVRLPEGALTIGRKKLAVAASIWAGSFMADEWPGYPTDVLVPEYPEWEERRWLDRELGEFAGVAARPRPGMLTSLMGG